MKIICVTGMRGCGKSIFGQIALSKGLPIYEMRSVVVDMMNEQNIIVNNRNLREFAKKIRESYGKSIVAKKMIGRLAGEKGGMVIIVGIRGMYEVREFREEYGNDNVVLLAIHSPPKARFERVMKRVNKEDDPKTYEEFLWSEEMELGYGISKAIALADVMLLNDGGLEEYIQQCEGIIDSIK